MARHLQAYGVGPETLVGVFVERSIDMLVAVLSVLKVGGAYLPLDPAYPADRLAYMIEDSGVPIIIAQEKLESRMPSVWAQIIFIDSAWPEIAAQSDEDLFVAVSPTISPTGTTPRARRVSQRA